MVIRAIFYCSFCIGGLQELKTNVNILSYEDLQL